MYSPRVVAARVGQTLMVVNRDMTLHNVHTVAAKGNSFNTTQPNVGMVFSYVLKGAEIIKLGCEPHRWMIGFVGVVDHPYFDVSNADGAFTIRDVPAGRQTVRVWHEVFGEMTKTVVVKANGSTTVDFAYTGRAGARSEGTRELHVPDALFSMAQLPE